MARAVHFRPLRDAQGNFRLRKVVLLVSRQMIPADSLSFRHGVLPLPDPPVCDIYNYSLLRRNRLYAKPRGSQTTSSAPRPTLRQVACSLHSSHKTILSAA